MTDERHSERASDQLTERQVERDSQLSAMFDGELPAGECELLARRLARDEALRAQWSRYSMIGAAVRAERGVALHDRVALRVQAIVAKEAAYGDSTSVDGTRTSVAVSAAKAGGQRWARFGYPLAGASIAAGVAAVSIFWLRGFQDPAENFQASTTASPTTIVLAPEPAGTTVAVNTAAEAPVASGEADLYSTPAPSSVTSIAPPARLANYVVAHSEYSGPLTRRMALLGIVGAESGESVAPEAAPPEEIDAP
jgi:negative regulator of sigma E activity